MLPLPRCLGPQVRKPLWVRMQPVRWLVPDVARQPARKLPMAEAGAQALPLQRALPGPGSGRRSAVL
jgi:hypothetical protein